MKELTRIAMLVAFLLGGAFLQAQEEEAGGEAEAETGAETEEETTVDIWTAAATGDLETLQALVDGGADINGQSGGELSVSPLMAATLGGQPKAVMWLLESGAEVDKMDQSGNTALTGAFFLGRAEIAKSLLDAGADVRIQNYEGSTPESVLQLDWATTDYLANTLMQLGVSEDEVMGGRQKIREIMEENLARMAETDILSAVLIGSTELVKKHIEDGVDVNVSLEGGMTLLGIAASENYDEVATALIEAGADIDHRSDSGATPLLIAAFFGHAQVAKVLVGMGADPSIPDYQGAAVPEILELDYATTTYIAQLIGTEIKAEDELTEGRAAIALMLKGDADEPAEESAEEAVEESAEE